MKKSYKTYEARDYIIDGIKQHITTDDVFYTTENYGDFVYESTDWKTIETTNVPNGGGNVTVTKTIEDINEGTDLVDVNGVKTTTNKEQIVTVKLDATTGEMDAGTTVSIAIKNDAGTTIETINYTFGAIAEDASASFVTKAGGLVSADNITCTFVFIDSTATFDIDATITISDRSNAGESVLFEVGTAVTTDGATVAVKIVDIDGEEITEDAIVDVYLLDASGDPVAVTTLAVGTAGTTLGDITVNSALVAISDTADLDVVVTNTTGTVYLGIRLTNGKCFTCPVIHTAI